MYKNIKYHQIQNKHQINYYSICLYFPLNFLRFSVHYLIIFLIYLLVKVQKTQFFSIQIQLYYLQKLKVLRKKLK